jgi:hypothetical protein
MIRIALGLLLGYTLLTWVGCKPKQHITRDTYTFKRDTVIYRPTVTVRDTIRCTDTLVYNHTYTKVVYAQDSSNKVQLSYTRTNEGNIGVECEAIPDTIRIPIETVITKEKIVNVPNDNKLPNWVWTIIIIVAGLLTFLVIINKLIR